MAKEQSRHSISSTAKMLINDWTALREIVGQVTLTRKAQHQPQDSSSLLTDINLQDATQGPLSKWLKVLSAKYALLTRIKTQNVITNDDALKPHILDRGMDIPTLNNPDINAAAVEKLQLQLDELARKQFSEWQTKIKEWQEMLVMQLMMHEVQLSELEIETFSYFETISELLEQFSEFKLEPPKFKGEYYNFSDYFKLKIILGAHSAWNRQHQAHNADAIDKLLKEFKSDLKDLSQQEAEFNTRFAKEIEQLVQP